MKALWWKLTVDYPWALGDWLWFHLAVPLLAQLERLTFKRIVYLAALTLLIVGMAQIGFAPSELTFVWAGDTAFYLEVASAVILFAVRGHARLMVRVIGQKMRAAAGRLVAALRQYGGTVRQTRNANAMRRKNGAPPPSGDEPAAWPTAWNGVAFA
jgi:hypothetical protein